MRMAYIHTAFLMTLREVFRRRIVILLLILIPSIFYLLTWLTTNMLPIPFSLASVEGEPVAMVPGRHIGLVFMGLASSGLLAAFISMSLIQKNVDATRRLIICGYQPAEVALSRLMVMLSIIVVVGLYVGGLLRLFFDPGGFLPVVGGFILVGFVYGSYGLLVGSLLKGELEGILVITLLANIDIGWLQNPIFYSGALNKVLIRSLPAYFPSQLSNIAAFSDYPLSGALMGGLLYGLCFLALSLLVFWFKMRKR